MNTSTRSRFLSIALSIAFISVPVIALAMHPANIGEPYIEHGTGKTDLQDSLNTQIQAFLAQIKILQEKIRTLTSSTQTIPDDHIDTCVGVGCGTNVVVSDSNYPNNDYDYPGSHGVDMCYRYSRNLSVGSRGDDVLQLQQILAGNGYLQSSNVTGYFGTQTKTALGLWQLSSGIPQVGTFGPKSRAFLKRNCDNSGIDGGIGGGWTIPDNKVPLPTPLPPYIGFPVPTNPPQYFCTHDAVLCPDGSYVGRTGPKCEAVCPATPKPLNITSFKECEKAGYPVAESYPRVCYAPNGKTFTEVVSEINTKIDKKRYMIMLKDAISDKPDYILPSNEIAFVKETKRIGDVIISFILSTSYFDPVTKADLVREIQFLQSIHNTQSPWFAATLDNDQLKKLKMDLRVNYISIDTPVILDDCSKGPC